MFMVGMIVVVMAGAGLSLVVDRRLKYSTGVGEIQREISANAAELEDLNSRYDGRSLLLANAGAKLRTGSMTHKGVLGQLATLRQRQATLEASRRRLRDTIASLGENFSRYRADYRRKTWAGAAGENLGNFTVRGGREYRQAVIARVTDVGLEIRHEHGIARIQAPDLDQKLQDRFQWRDEERRKRLKEDRENQGGKSQEPVADGSETPEAPVPVINRFQQSRDAADSEKLKVLRQQVIGWQAKASKLNSDKAEASSRAGYGGQASVPGSLETWQAKAARLGNELVRARAALEIARSDLAMLAPNDPLLVQPASDR